MQRIFSKKRILSERKLKTRKNTNKALIKNHQKNSSKVNHVTVDTIVTQPKFIEILLKLIDTKLNYRDNTTWEMSIIIVVILLGIFILNTFPSEAKSFKLLTATKVRQNAGKFISKSYSGLIIKVKGKNKFYSNMSPKIISVSGNSIFCNATNFSHEQFNYLIREGIATFTSNINSAKHRSGNNPLIINAITTQNSDTVIISNQHANQILSANRSNKFLERFKVSFLIN